MDTNLVDLMGMGETPAQKLVLVALAALEEERITIQQIQTITGLSRRTVIHALQQLAAQGRIEIIRHHGKPSEYRIVQPVQQAHRCNDCTRAADAPVQQLHRCNDCTGAIFAPPKENRSEINKKEPKDARTRAPQATQATPSPSPSPSSPSVSPSPLIPPIPSASPNSHSLTPIPNPGGGCRKPTSSLGQPRARARSAPEAKPAPEQATSTTSASKRGMRPEAWMALEGVRSLPDEWRRWCAARYAALDPDEVWQQFRDYWVAATGARATKLDWFATWRVWCRREAERMRHRQQTRARDGPWGRRGLSPESEAVLDQVLQQGPDLFAGGAK